MPRVLKDWIEGFELFTEVYRTPDIFRRWAAIGAIAGALERKVWVRTSSTLFPNLFVFLVGPPGQGKGESLFHVDRLWRDLKDHFVGPTRISIQSLVDSLAAAKRRILLPDANPPYDEFNYLKLLIDELGVFLTEYSNEQINNLITFYDCKVPYEEHKRSSKLHLRIDRPQITLLAGTTPNFLMNTLPESAWGEGFMSRTTMVYSGESFHKEIFPDEDTLDKLEGFYPDLLKDLETIGGLYGQMHIGGEVREAFRAWAASRYIPEVNHPRLESYAARRPAHLLKLCMIFSVSRSNDLVITLEDYQRAFRTMAEAELVMTDIFKAARVGGDTRIIEEAWHFVFTAYAGGQKPIHKFRLLQFLMERAPSHAVPKILQNMVDSGMLKPEIGPGDQIFFRPGTKPRGGL